MQLTFLYQPVDDLRAAVTFYAAELGWEEAWREADSTVAFWMPGRAIQIMLSTDPDPAGPMYLVDDVDRWCRDHASIVVTKAKAAIPGGAVVGLRGPGDGAFYVFEMSDPV